MSERADMSLLCRDCPSASANEELIKLLARGYVQPDIQGQEEPLQYLQHLQRTVLVGLVASGYIHDLNNLLTMIIGGADLAANELPENHPARANVEAVRKAGQSAGAVAQRLMAFVRRRPPELRAVSLYQLAQECLPMLSRLIGQQVVVASILAPNLWLVRADKVQVEQVLLNLLINARDAMPYGGEVTIAGVNVEAGIAEGVFPGEYVQLSVSDTGTGMSPELRERLFEPFVSGRSRGIGLGLFNCYAIVKELGGAIHVDSQPGRGTTFQIYLPRAEV